MRKQYKYIYSSLSIRYCLIFEYVLQCVVIVLLLSSHANLQKFELPYVFRDEDSSYIDDEWFNTVATTEDADTNYYLGVDEESQCRYREYPELNYSTCYDENCRWFPRNVQFQYATLKIFTTSILRLRPGDLSYRNGHLETLMLYENDDFDSIEPGAFEGMNALQNLIIYKNLNFTHLEPDSFKGLINLNALLLSGNSFVRFSDIVVALHPICVPTLRKISLSKLDASNLTRAKIEPMIGLPVELLSMTSSNIRYFDPDILMLFSSLHTLHLNKNKLSVDNLVALMHKIVELGRPVRFLSLSSIGLRSVPITLLEEIEPTYITHLKLSYNYFERIEKFPKMSKIKKLNLEGVSAVAIEDEAFAQMPSLETLLLKRNNLFTVSAALNLVNVYNLDISGNTENAFFLPLKAFSNMCNLRSLNMSMNSIGVIQQQTFYGLLKLLVLDLENSNIHSADNGTFANLRSLEFLKLKNNVFPGRHLFREIYAGLTALKVLILKMPNLQHLSLDHNSLESLESYLFRNLTKLVSLDISNNNIVAWNQQLFPTNNNLREVKASSNLFRQISPAMVKDFRSLKALDVRNNGYSCTCELIGSYSGVITKEVALLLNSKPPRCSYPIELGNTTIQDYITNGSIASYCDTLLHANDNSVVLVAVPASIVAVILCCAIVVIYLFRWHLRYWIFLLRVGLNGSSSLRASLECKKTYRYDAFVSYCNEDRSFVIGLVSMLENYGPPLKLCVYERDFEIGTVISESVLESVADSRRTLLVISDAYIKSQWCRWEVQVAENHRLFFEDEYGRCVNDTLVMVKLGDISQTKISPMLRYLMNTRIYLQWDPDAQEQRDFWKKLRKALKPPGRLVKHSVFN